MVRVLTYRGWRLLCAALSMTGSVAIAQPKGPLGPGEHYQWSIRASHSDEILLAVGDSLDVVLLRDRCGADAGHGMKGCWGANDVSVTPKWNVAAGRVARVRSLPAGSWRFGPGAAGARIHALRAGATRITARLPDGRTAWDSLWVILAPGAVRVVLEPKPATIVAGDTVRFRITARNAADSVVAVLRVPLGWNVVGPPDSLGFTPVAFSPRATGGVLVARLGRLTDSLRLHFVPRPEP